MPTSPFLAPTLAPFSVGPFRVTAVEARERMEGVQSPSKNSGDGWLYTWRAEAPDAELVVGYGVWDHGDRGVMPVSASGGTDAFRHLHRGSLRFSVRPAPKGAAVARGQYVAELGQARVRRDGWVKAFKATEAELDEGAGLDVGELLASLGASGYGRAGDLLNVGGTRQNYCCVTFSPDEPRVPVAAFVATRALPLLAGRTVD